MWWRRLPWPRLVIFLDWCLSSSPYQLHSCSAVRDLQSSYWTRLSKLSRSSKVGACPLLPHHQTTTAPCSFMVLRQVCLIVLVPPPTYLHPGQLAVTDLNKGELLSSWQPHNSTIVQLCITADETSVWSLGQEGTLVHSSLLSEHSRSYRIFD